jgi:ubiquinone biosynthesis protein UbiJ
MSIHKTRGSLYKLARLLGDVQADSSGSPQKMTKRVGRRVTSRAAGKLRRKLFK